MLNLVEIQSHASNSLVHHGFAASWSENNQIAMITDKGVQILKSTSTSCLKTNWKLHYSTSMLVLFATLILAAFVDVTQASDITGKVFGSATDGMPAAFGNFNSDKFTDLFVLCNNQKTVAILLGSDTEPLLQYKKELSCTFDRKITSIVPGDFDGDAQMDVLVTVVHESNQPDINDVYVFWGETNQLHCNTSTKPLIEMLGQPLAMDFNQDMIVDLFGVDKNGTRMFWVFQKGRNIPPQLHKLVEGDARLPELKTPHSHAFLDLNGDSYGDLYLTTKNNIFEVWLYNEHKQNFYLHQNISLPENLKVKYVGQTVFQDLTLEGCLDHLVPVCLTEECTDSALLIWHQEDQTSAPKWSTLHIKYKDWNLAYPDKSKLYLDTLTLRAGDFNMDGYPDLLATMKNNGAYKTVLLENVECKENCHEFPRTFEPNFDALNPLSTNTTLGVFYDFLQDGILDVILVHSEGSKSSVSAFRNSLDYDANFVKVMVSMGQTNNRSSLINNPLGIKQFTYGTNLPGPTVFYSTTTQEGQYRAAISTQLPQSAHFSLMLPYTIFGLGRMPNFVDQLQVHVYGHVRPFFQLIPNSQVVVIPTPRDKPNLWKVQLFVTPSKLIVRSVFALLGTCLLIMAIIGVQYWKERREDHREKLQEAHRFHF